MVEKLDILAFGAHPDDIELGAGGTLAAHARMGKKIGLIDLTLGELGTRGTVEIRLQEARDAAILLGASVRENLQMADGFFTESEENRIKIIEVIRKYQPEIVLCNALSDRHPDHKRGGDLVSDACFYAGLQKIETRLGEEIQTPWRPKQVYRYIQFHHIEPDFLMDVSADMETKMAAVRAHTSQFFNPGSAEPKTLIASEEFMHSIEQRAAYFGLFMGVSYAEGFTVARYPGVKDLFHLY